MCLKSLSWIDSSEMVPEIQELPTRKHKQKSAPVKEAAPVKAIAIEPAYSSNAVEIHPVADKNTSLKGLPEGWTRATFIVKQEMNEKLKALAYWERMTVKELLHEALMLYLQDKNVRAMPKKKNLGQQLE